MLQELCKYRLHGNLKRGNCSYTPTLRRFQMETQKVAAIPVNTISPQVRAEEEERADTSELFIYLQLV